MAIGNVELRVHRSWNANGIDYASFNTSGYLSDVNGDYSMALISHNDYSVTLLPPSGSGLAQTMFSGEDVSSDTNRDFSLNTANTLSGIVYGPDGTTPASGVRLSVYDQTSGVRIGNTIQTDGSGAYSFALSSSIYKIRAEGVDSEVNISTPGSWNINPITSNLAVNGNTTHDMTLPFVTLSGKTTDSNGVAIGNVELRVHRSWNANGIDYASFNTSGYLSDVNGDYSMALISHNDYPETILPPVGSGFAQTIVDALDVSNSILQNIILPFVDTQNPKIVSGPYVSNITDTTAVVEWQTDEPTSSDVIVGGSTVSVSGYSAQHSVLLTGLIASTLYSVDVYSNDKAGNALSIAGQASFTTAAAPDTSAPTLLNGPIVTGITQDRAVVTWTTSEPATSSLSYGDASLALSETVAGLREQHQVEITGLSASTRYSVQVHATDASGNGPTHSPMIQFTSLAVPDTRPPVIVAGPMVTNVSDSEVTIAWDTDEPASSGISSNDGTAYNVYTDDTLKTHHEVRLTGLNASTLYHYTVASKDEKGNGPTLSQEAGFTTSATPDTDKPVLIDAL